MQGFWGKKLHKIAGDFLLKFTYKIRLTKLQNYGIMENSARFAQKRADQRKRQKMSYHLPPKERKFVCLLECVEWELNPPKLD